MAIKYSWMARCLGAGHGLYVVLGYGLVMMMTTVVNLIAGRANPAGRMETVNANPKGTLSWQQSSKADDRRESGKTSTFASEDIFFEKLQTQEQFAKQCCTEHALKQQGLHRAE